LFPGVKETTELYRSLQKLQIADYHFFEHNRRGLSECYNEYLDRFAGTDWIVVLVHSTSRSPTFSSGEAERRPRDVRCRRPGGICVLRYRCADDDVRLARVARTVPLGAVEHPTGNGQAAWFNLGPTPRRCVVLDGLFLAVNMRSVGSVRFDPRFRFHSTTWISA
jgi:hypothetical protein